MSNKLAIFVPLGCFRKAEVEIARFRARFSVVDFQRITAQETGCSVRHKQTSAPAFLHNSWQIDTLLKQVQTLCCQPCVEPKHPTMKNIVAETKNALGLVLGAGLIARLGLLLYGRWQDQHMVVKYTDIDYHVFTDAAEYVTKVIQCFLSIVKLCHRFLLRFISFPQRFHSMKILFFQGESPYNRPTYRYTPLLAWLLTPNITLCTEFGKIIFIVCDVLAGYLLYRILRLRSCPTSLATGCAALWLLNPLPATVSSRGNAESLIAVLVLGTLYCIATSGSLNLCIAGLLFGMSVHVKIYPVTYALPIYLMLNGDYSGDRERRTFLGADILPNKARMVFVIASAFSFICLTSLCFFW